MAFQSFFNWSGGKDSALALYYILRNKNYAVQKLLTTLNGQNHRVSMHGVREELLEQQASAIGIPLQKLFLPDIPSMKEYEAQMLEEITRLQIEKFTHAFFGDIFLEDLKSYREAQLATVGIKAEFPLWKRNTKELVHEFIQLGFKTMVVCVNDQFLDKSFCGRMIDEDFINDLPPNVDACGENGEFHTFVFDGPLFAQAVPVIKGEIVYKKYPAPRSLNSKEEHPAGDSEYGFYFCDLLPGKR